VPRERCRVNEFDGFPIAGLDFLRELGDRDKAWFDANRATYQTSVVAPTKTFVEVVGERLAAGFAPAIVAQPKANGSISPINNDVRFSPDKPPYKDHLLLRFWEGADKKTAPTLFIRLSADDVGFATGAALSDLGRWREVIDDDTTGSALADALAALARGRELDVAGEGYKRVPKPYGDDHPRAGLLRHKMIQARWSEPTPPEVHSAEFVDFCMERFDACAPVHRWLATNL
jgi:uncharacterized protein (TIGR02453 family)